MQTQRYQQLNPLALAVAAGCMALIFGILPMAGMLSGYGYRYSYGHMTIGDFGVGFVLFSWIFFSLLATLAGAVVAWIYNVVNGSPKPDKPGPVATS